MNIHNLANVAKPVFVISLLVLSIIGQGFIQSAYANHGEDPGITKPAVIGSNTLSFRDITNTNPQTSTITIDNSEAEQGILKINLEELDANLDITAIDMVTVTANSTTSGALKANVLLTETGVNTGIFTGELRLSSTETVDNKLQVSEGDVITYNHFEDSLGVAQSHSEESQGVGRFQAVIEILSAGNVKITDVLIDTVNEAINQPFIPRSHGVNLELLDGATLDPANPPVITMSYANLDLGGEDPAQLTMYYNPGPFDVITIINLEIICTITPGCVWDPVAATGMVVQNIDAGWQEIRTPALILDLLNDPSHDLGAKTISSDIANSVYGVNGGQIFGPVFGSCCPTEAQFMLGFKTGSIGGGGGGGLVKPGFVVNALAGAQAFSSFFKSSSSGVGGGSSGAGPSQPTVLTSSIDIVGDTPNSGFAGIVDASVPNSPESTKTVSTDKNLEFKYNMYENGGIDNLYHATMYFFSAAETDSKKHIDISKSQAYITFNRGEPVQVVDPHGYFANAGFEISKKDTWNLILKYDITFAKPMPESHILLRSWDSQRNSADKILPNAITVTESSIVNAQSENQPTENEPSFVLQSENQPSENIATPEITDIPLWVKNNAMWWHEKQIDDSDFVSGIEYLINEKVITIPETEVTGSISSKEIPDWISNVAGFWSSDLITDAEFVQAMQWLITNGVMVIS